MERRKFIHDLFRWFFAGILAVLSVFLLLYRSKGFQRNCSFGPACRNCSRFNICEAISRSDTTENGKEAGK